MSGLKVHRGQRICTLIQFVDDDPVVMHVSLVTGFHPFGFDGDGLLHYEGSVSDVSEIKVRPPLPSKSEQKRRAIQKQTVSECPVCAVQQRTVDAEGEAL